MINRDELAAIHPGSRQQLSYDTGLIRKHWCPFIASLGRCNRMCSENPICSNNLTTVYEGIHSTARSREAVFIWRIRDIRSKLRDQSEIPSLPVNRWGEVRTGGALEALARELI